MRKGFTLIELVTVIAMVAILATVMIIIINPGEQVAKARDTQRKSDLAQIKRALEQYYNDHGVYPDGTLGTYSACPYCIINNDSGVTTIKTWGSQWSPYMDVIPSDPVSSQAYKYVAVAGGQSYYLYTRLERGTRDTQACTGAQGCNGSGASILCGTAANAWCNYGVISSNLTSGP